MEQMEKRSTTDSTGERAILYLGESLSLTSGQQATLKCLANSQDWPYTLRKLLSIVFEDLDHASLCGVGKPRANKEHTYE